MNLLKRRTDLQLVPPSVLRLSLVPPTVAPRLGAAAARHRCVEADAAADGRCPRPGPTRPGGRRAPRPGEVAPGFSKQEILKELPPDPRAPGGLYERIGGLLAELRSDRLDRRERSMERPTTS